MLSRFRRSSVLNALMGGLFVTTFFLLGNSTGKVGVTKKTSTDGCDCHGQSNAVSVVIDGPASLAPGATGNYTVTITGGPLAKAGTNIAASSGTLASADNFLQLISGELTHTSPKTPANSKVTFSFKYTAPLATGTVTLYANGNSVNGNNQSSGDQWNFAQNKTVNITTVGVDKISNTVSGFELEQNYPNPFNPSTKIRFSVPESGFYTLKVYNLNGEEVATLFSNVLSAGIHESDFKASQLPSGIYMYKLSGNGYSSIRKMVLAK